MDAPPPAPDALVARLASRDGRAVADAKAALVRIGDPGWAALERAAAGDDPLLRARARQFLGEQLRARGLARLDALLAAGPVDLLQGLFAIDEVLGHRRQEAVRARVGEWSDRLARELRSASGDRAAAQALRRVLGGPDGLQGATEDFHHADHVSVSHAALARRGLPLTLCALYAEVARRAGLVAGLLPFPGHVLLAVGEGAGRAVLDPFSGGVAISRAASEARLLAMGAPPSPMWLEPASDRSMVIRHGRNLAAALERHGRRRDARRVVALVERHG